MKLVYVMLTKCRHGDKLYMLMTRTKPVFAMCANLREHFGISTLAKGPVDLLTFWFYVVTVDSCSLTSLADYRGLLCWDYNGECYVYLG